MKGIKECLNWMLDNPDKLIKANGYQKCRFNHELQMFEQESYNIKNEWYDLDSDKMYIFNKAEWQEVIEPVDFITAYNDCLENNAKYIIRGDNDPIATIFGVDGDVQLFTLIKGLVITDKWIKVG